MSQRLQLDPNLTLETAKKMVRQREAVGEQQNLLKREGTATNLDAIQHKFRKGNLKKKPFTKSENHYQSQKSCSRCGKEQHARSKCSARDATCHRCQRKGHYKSKCFSKTVAKLETTENHMDSAYLDTAMNRHGQPSYSYLTKTRKDIVRPFTSTTGGSEESSVTKTGLQSKSSEVSRQIYWDYQQLWP